jgi:hypothetical protein
MKTGRSASTTIGGDVSKVRTKKYVVVTIVQTWVEGTPKTDELLAKHDDEMQSYLNRDFEIGSINVFHENIVVDAKAHDVYHRVIAFILKEDI